MRDTGQFVKQYFIASDFDQTLSFNDSGTVLSELVGISAKEFEREDAEQLVLIAAPARWEELHIFYAPA